MCDPVTIASAALTIGSGVAQFSQQQAAYSANRDSALSSFANQTHDIGTREAQEQDAASQDQFNTNLAARAAQSTARNSAGGAGVSGNSIDALVNDFSARAGRYDASVQANLKNTTAQLEGQKRGVAAQTVDRINSVQKPSFLDAGLRIASGLTNNYAGYVGRTNTDPLGDYLTG